jgi:predicted Zn-dependent protease
MSRSAIELALTKGRREAAAQLEAAAAVREALFGNTVEAKRILKRAQGSFTGRDAEYGAALALAIAGESTQAQKLADNLAKQFPEDTLVKFSYLPVLRAVIELNHGQPQKALDLLQTATRYELGFLGSASVGFDGSLYPIYFRGEAYLRAGRGSEAAAEFQKILDHRGIAFAAPIVPLARLQLGRALVLSGDKVGAKAAYQEFLTLWNDADRDIPIFKQARLQYAADFVRP